MWENTELQSLFQILGNEGLAPSVTDLAMYSLPNRNGHVQTDDWGDATFHEGEKKTDFYRILWPTLQLKQ
jgi:hypothetical protein